MRPILVTGISGLIGGHVWTQLAHREDVWGAYGTSGPVPLMEDRQIHLDLASPDGPYNAVTRLHPRCILHLGAMSSLGACRSQPLQAWRINHAGTRRLAHAAAEVSSRVVFTSTEQVFDGAKGNYKEGDPPYPVNVYGETKKSAERSLFALVDNAAVVRLSNTFGPPAFRGTSFSEWVLTQERNGDPIPLFIDQYRSPIDVITVAHALIELIDHPFRGLLHLGGPNRLDRVSFGNMILRHLDRDTTAILEQRSAKGDPEGTMPLDVSFDISLAARTLETHIPNIDEGLTLAYGPMKTGLL